MNSDEGEIIYFKIAGSLGKVYTSDETILKV